MTRHANTIGAALLGAALTAGVLLVTRRLGDEPRLPSPAYLNPIARGVLTQRMARHAEHMSTLVRAVVLLDRQAVIDRAGAIAEEPTLARPTTDDATELNALLPPKFFELQDDLQSAARRLVMAARGQSIDELAEAQGELTKACVRCHGTYVQGLRPVR